MNKDIERQINKIYNEVYDRVYNQSGLRALARRNRMAILSSAAKLQESEAYTEFAKQFAKELAKKGLRQQRGIWRKFYQAARRSHYVALPKTFTEYENEVMQTAIINNFQMIKSIPQEVVKIMEHKYATTLIEEVAKGKLSRGAFERQLKSHGHKNAKLIARTETAKLQTAILQGRAQNLGSVAYEWRASHDRRTRPSHRDMDGVIVFWRQGMEKPNLDNMVGNAGEFPNCRCTPQPIIDEDEITKPIYKVYDYRKHEVVKMSRTELITALKNGGLN